ncbi:hypothetical protein ACFFMN_39255 [Planobispora siamensis]|uniref:Uncharacterized protein n=1 Tax=Planobispora siamensis TaxID=936338 RepID=A0A8J3SVF5_9ACTN|nr:hypothetical protein [Planobispora siamensis]GIH96298.1 hypothetical protein Psi01_69280 [Planobispora siamensis]
MMRLTWKDAVATVVAGVIVAVYVAFLQGVDMAIISSVRGVATTILVLGFVGGCALSSADELYAGRRTPMTQLFTAVASLLGVTALVAGIIALAAESEVALAVLFAATIALWFVSTLRHALRAPAAAPAGRDVHEVIEPERTARE